MTRHARGLMRLVTAASKARGPEGATVVALRTMVGKRSSDMLAMSYSIRMG